MIKIRRSIVIILLFFSIIANATNANQNQEDVQKAYYAWCAAIGTAKGDPSQIVKFYAPEAILLPTLSHELLINREGGLSDYFKKLTSRRDIKCTTDKLITRTHGATATNTGLYTFSYQDSDGKIETIPARFTFFYHKVGNQWLITKHHSSKMPSSES